jgi:enoyl-CoA hydratase/carnithine racemase
MMMAVYADQQRKKRGGYSMSDLIKSSRDGTVATITIDRAAEGNVLTLDMLRDLTAAIKSAAASDAKLIVLRSTGADFCRGRDPKRRAGQSERARAARSGAAAHPRRLCRAQRRAAADRLRGAGRGARLRLRHGDGLPCHHRGR